MCGGKKEPGYRVSSPTLLASDAIRLPLAAMCHLNAHLFACVRRSKFLVPSAQLKFLLFKPRVEQNGSMAVAILLRHLLP